LTFYAKYFHKKRTKKRFITVLPPAILPVGENENCPGTFMYKDFRAIAIFIFAKLFSSNQ